MRRSKDPILNTALLNLYLAGMDVWRIVLPVNRLIPIIITLSHRAARSEPDRTPFRAYNSAANDTHTYIHGAKPQHLPPLTRTHDRPYPRVLHPYFTPDGLLKDDISLPMYHDPSPYMAPIPHLPGKDHQDLGDPISNIDPSDVS